MACPSYGTRPHGLNPHSQRLTPTGAPPQHQQPPLPVSRFTCCRAYSAGQLSCTTCFICSHAIQHVQNQALRELRMQTGPF